MLFLFVMKYNWIFISLNKTGMIYVYFLRTDINISFTYRSQLNRMTFYTYIFSFLIIFFVVSHNVEVQFINLEEFYDTERKDSRFSLSVTDIFWQDFHSLIIIGFLEMLSRTDLGETWMLLLVSISVLECMNVCKALTCAMCVLRNFVDYLRACKHKCIFLVSVIIE